MIPYASATVDDDGHLIRVCPDCGERIREEHDDTGEQTSQHYAEHYAAAHEHDADDPENCWCSNCLLDDERHAREREPRIAHDEHGAYYVDQAHAPERRP